MTNRPLPADAAPDQSNCPPDYYRRTNGMLHELPPDNLPDAITDNPDLTRLDGMDRDGLIALIKTIAGARWGEVALMTKEERLEAAKLKLWHGGLTEKEIYKALPALNAAMDREIGKPAQSVAITVKDEGISKLSDDRLLRLEKELARMTGQDAIIIAPEPKKLNEETCES